MPDLPAGTVTFLFTDIEGHTALWEQQPAAMSRALARHDALIEQIVAEHAGVVVRPRGEGDSRFAVFARASDAVAAAAAMQQALHAQPWPTLTPLRVRMALHTGEAELRAGDYYGSAVNRCARLRAVAHGGQTLVSLATEQLARSQIASGVTLRDLGEHRLKDVRLPERIYQLVLDGLPQDFPPLATLDAQTGPNRSNLPLQPTSFIGRGAEIAAIRQRMLDPQVRLLTLTGPGGTGKTRLALQVAAELLEAFADGVWLVELAPMHDPALVGPAIAAALGVKESGAQPLIESLKSSLRDRHLLLVLDNFEQVLVAGPLVVELLNAAPLLKVLVTSRAALHLRSEHEVPVPPLALPVPGQQLDPTTLAQYAAVELFMHRAHAVKPDFVVTTATAPVVVEICVRLDGLPLAIELAAARSKLLPAQALLARLQNRLRLLTGGARDLPTRQQTLRGTIDWSFSLLEPSEQRLFTRLGVFVGGWTVEAAEAVCNADGDLGLDVLDGLQSLLDKSLLKLGSPLGVDDADGEPRFRRLETIREYAVERLAASGEAEMLRERHARYYIAWLEALPAQFPHGHLDELVGRMRTEMGNLAATIHWISEQGEIDLAVRWSDAAGLFMSIYSAGDPWQAMDRWRQALMDSSEHVPVRVRAKALARLGRSCWGHDDYAQAATFLEEAVALSRTLDDSVELALAVIYLGDVYRDQELFARAALLYEEGHTLAQAHGHQALIGTGYHVMAELALLQENYPRALALEQASIRLVRHLSIDWGVAAALIIQGFAAQHQGDSDLASQSFRESLSVARLHQILPLVCASLVGFATMAANQGLPGSQSPQAAARAARLLGAIEEILHGGQARMSHVHRREYSRATTAARAQLDEATFAAAWAAGRTMTLEQAIAYALDEAPDAEPGRV